MLFQRLVMHFLKFLLKETLLISKHKIIINYSYRCFISERYQYRFRQSQKQVQVQVSVQFSCSVMSNSFIASMPGFPGYHQFSELAQTHVHQVGDAIQLSHPLLSHLLLSLILPSTRVFSKESILHIMWLKYWRFSFSILPMIIQD